MPKSTQRKMSERSPKQVIVCRRDLNMRKGKIASQTAHAAMSFLLRGRDGNHFRILTEVESAWLSGSFTKIVTYVNSEAELLALVQAGEAAGIEVHAIHDNGLTEFHGVKTLTCAAFGPDYPDKLDPVTGKLPLL
jgi:PTH2 family peptidyl-tRNA hydrolase